MARKKLAPKHNKTPDAKKEKAVEPKTAATKMENEETVQEPTEEIPTPAKKGIKKGTTSTEAIKPETNEISAPLKKAAKKAASTTPKVSEEDVARMLPDPHSGSSAPLAATPTEQPQAVKKVGKRKPATVKAAAAQEPEVQQQQTNVVEAMPEVIEHIEPVKVSEEKNHSFIHKLAHTAEHHHTVETYVDIHGETDVKTEPALEKKITFIVNYYTKLGQSIFITAKHPLFGIGNTDEAIAMNFLDTDHWKAEITINNTDFTEPVHYTYILKEEDGSIVYDGGKEKILLPSSFIKNEITILDSWDFAGYYDNAFFTEPFKNVLLKNNYTHIDGNQPETYTHNFKVKAPLLLQGQVVCLTGSTDTLKNWDVNNPFLLSKKETEEFWNIKLDLSNAAFPLYYKYGVFDIQKKQLVQLENGDNRVLNQSAGKNTETVVNDGFIRTSNNTWKGAGVAIPVFSLRTQNSFGCGEFLDIKKLADWSKSVGLKLIQLLPVNDTTSTKTWQDSYPYAAISAFALHPMYVNVEAVTAEENKHFLDEYRNEAKRLNKLSSVDYEGVNDIKWKIIHHIYPLQKDATFNSEDYKAFFEDNKHWLEPYAAFCTLRDKFNTADFTKWNEYKTYDAAAIANLLQSDEEKSKAGMYYFVQYHLHLQLKEAAEYAHNNGIVIKGDIAIGISRNSADAWQNPALYNLDMQAGAPPDAFAVKGQNWGFPTYNWQRMKENGFAWWKQRFSQMSNYFDAFRIDHILGFFRIWSIPLESVEGIMGHFVPALPVHINEFHQWNTYFDYKRYCKPFINDQILNDLFGDQQNYVRDNFVTKDEDGTYALRPELATQRRVETYFAIREQNAHNAWLKQSLFDLISNVILFEEKGSNGTAFHFRFGMEKTLSYQYLDDYTKKQLYYLSVNYFYERQNDFWRQEALQKLPALKQETDMLICGEDLGMVPSTVPRVMQDLGLLSLEVQRMPKDEKATFTNLEVAPYLSVVTPSTHDMSTIRGWWEEDRSITQNFYNHQLGREGEAPHNCEPWINRQIVEQHLYSPAIWSIFQLQDLMGIDEDLRRQNPNDERINVPAIPNYYWRYRIHISLEDLMSQNDFNSDLKEMIGASGR